VRQKKRWQKRELSRTIVIHCVNAMTAVLVWAVLLKTAGAAFGWAVELSDVLTFTAAAFGGELLLLAFKRIFAKEETGNGENL
jgi:hypothetical protein